MTSPVVGAARIEVLGDLRPLATEMNADLQATAAKLAGEFGKVFGPAMEEEMAAAGALSGEVFYKGMDGRLRTAEGKFVSRGRAAAAGYTDAMVAGMTAGAPKVAEAGAVQGRAAAKAAAAQGTAAGKGFAARMKEVLLGSHMITGAIFAGIGYEAVKMAGDFQTAMVRLVTAAGESKANLAGVGAGILEISRQTGVSTHQLGDAAYMVESAGYHGKAALEVLRASAQGAKVDMADANIVANALTTALTDMGSKAGSPAKMMSQLVATVGHGKMTMDELASSIHSVLPNAAAIGLSFAQTAGAIATMTAQGISAQQATQNLNHAILSLANPTAVQTKSMAAFGLNASTVAKNLGTTGLTGTLDQLQRAVLAHMGPAGLTMTKALNSSEIAAGKVKTMLGALPPDVQGLAKHMMDGSITAHAYSVAVGKLSADHSVLGRQFLMTYNRAHGFADILKAASPDAMTFSAAMAKMTGGQVGLQVALHLTGENMGTYRSNVKAINAAHTEAGGNVEGWAEKQRTFNQVMSQVVATIKTALIAIGMKLLPVMTDVGNIMLHDVFPAIKWTVNALHSLYDVIQGNDGLKVFLGVIAGAVLAMKALRFAVLAYRTIAMTLYYTQMLLNGALTANPIGLAVVAVAALAGAAVYAYQHFKPFRDVVDAVGRALRTGFVEGMHIARAVVGSAVSFITDHWKLLAGIMIVLAGPFVIGVALITGAVYLLVTHFRQISRTAQDLYHAVTGWFRRTWSDTTGFVSRIYRDVTGWFGRMGAAVAGFASDIWHDVTRAWDKVVEAITGRLRQTGQDIRKHWRLYLFIITGGLGLIYIIIQDHWKQITGFFSRIYHDVTGWAARTWHGVVGIWDALSGAVARQATRLYNDVAGPVGRLYRSVTGWFDRAHDRVTARVQAMAAYVARQATRLYNDVAGPVGRLYRTVTGFFDRTGDAVDSRVRAMVAAVGRQATRLYDDVTGAASRLWHTVTRFFGRMRDDVAAADAALWRLISGAWDRGYADVTGLASRIWHDVTGFFGRMRDDVTHRFDQMVAGVKTAWDKVKDIVAAPIRWVVDTVYDQGIVPMWNAVAGVLHENSMKLDPVHFARGGVVPGTGREGDNVPIYATAGEVVVPLNIVNAFGGPGGLMRLLGFGPRSGGAGEHFIIGGGVVGGIGSAIGGGARAVGGAARSAAGATARAVGGIAGDLAHLARGALAAGLAPVVHRLEAAADTYLNPLGGVGHLMDVGVHNVGDRVLAWARGDDKKSMADAASGAGGAARWAPLVSQVLAMLGAPASALKGVLSLINKESGGNPNAINLTDSNARAGHPSQGLMQTIPSTFAAYAGPYASRGITDPLANIYAGVNYALHRYGAAMLAGGGNHDAAGNYVGYDTGGILKPGQVGKNYGKAPERILSAAQTKSFDKLVALLSAPGWAGGIPSHFSAATGKLGSLQTDLSKWGDRLLGDHHNDRLQAFLTRENRLLQGAAANRSGLATKLAAANQRLSDAVTNRANYGSTVRGNAMGYGALTATDTTALYSGSIVASLKDRLGRLVAYRAGLKKLAAMGLNAQSYQELVDAGPEQGQYFVTALLNGGKADLRRVNSLQHSLTAAATGLGRDTSGHLYDAGVQAAQGVVDGLRKGETAIEAQMVKIGKTISAAIRRELKIHSPSRVMFDLATNTAQGFVNGLDAHAPHIEDAAVRMTRPLRHSTELAALAHTESINQLTAVLGSNPGRTGPLVHVEHLSSAVDLDLFTRQAAFNERQGVFN